MLRFLRLLQVFSQVDILFSIGGRYYTGEPITYTYMEDKIFETSRNITIKLHHRVGKFVKLRLHFSDRWIMVSEVTFDSGEQSLALYSIHIYSILCTFVTLFSSEISIIAIARQLGQHNIYSVFYEWQTGTMRGNEWFDAKKRDVTIRHLISLNPSSLVHPSSDSSR